MSNAKRRTYSAEPARVEVREPTDGDDSDGLFRIRMPVSSTMEARDGKAFSRDRLEGWTRQIEAGDVGVFLDHGRSVGDSRYSALGKLGYWDDPAVEDRDGGAELVADAVLMDPAELDADLDLGALRTALNTLRAQAAAGVPLASSVGWSEDTGDRDLPGESDLLEISIVGIPSDPTTTTASADSVALARAVSSASEGFDPDAFAETYRAITREDVDEATPVDVDGHTPDTQGGRNIDDPAFEPGDAVMWSWDGEMVHGRVADIHEEYTPPEADDPITGEDGEAVYSIYEYEDQQDELSETANVAKPESSLSESTADIPTRDMSEDDTDESGDDPGTDDDRDEQPDLREMEDDVRKVREMCERMDQRMDEMYTEMMGDGEENADGEDGEDDGDEEDDDEGENSADADADGEERTVTIDGEERDVDDVATELRELREQANKAEPDDSKTTNRAEGDDGDNESDGGSDSGSGFGFAGAEE